MNLSRLNNWLTLVANLGVLAGIFFLIIEINQNTSQLQSDARATRASEVIALKLFSAENLEIADSCLELAETPRESLHAGSSLAGGFYSAVFEIQMWQFQETGLPSYLVQRYNDYYRYNPCYANLWETEKQQYDQDFVAFMDDVVYAARN